MGTISNSEDPDEMHHNAVFILLCILMDFPIHIDTISMGLSIVNFKESRGEFSKL